MKNLILLAVLLAGAAIYTVYEERHALWTDQKDGKETTRQALAEAPDFTFKDLKGKSYSLSDFKGKAVILNFWASWCAPCLVEFPQMLELAGIKKDNLVIIFMSVDDDIRNAERFLQKQGKALHKKNVIVGHDKDRKISQALFQTYKLPESFLINKDLQLAEKIVGASVIWNDEAMQSRIDDLAD